MRTYTEDEVRRIALRALWLSLREVERQQNETQDHEECVTQAIQEATSARPDATSPLNPFNINETEQ